MRKFRSAILSSSRTSVAVSPSLVWACTCTQTLQSTASPTDTNVLLGCNSYLTRNLQSQKGLCGKLQQVQYIAKWHRGTRSRVGTLLSYLNFILLLNSITATWPTESRRGQKVTPPPPKISFHLSHCGDINFLSTLSLYFGPFYIIFTRLTFISFNLFSSFLFSPPVF